MARLIMWNLMTWTASSKGEPRYLTTRNGG